MRDTRGLLAFLSALLELDDEFAAVAAPEVLRTLGNLSSDTVDVHAGQGFAVQPSPPSSPKAERAPWPSA